MEYIFKNRPYVMLIAVAGADNSLVGLKVDGFEFILMRYSELKEIVIETRGIYGLGRFEHSLLWNGISIIDDDEVLVLEYVCQNTSPQQVYTSFFDMLRLFKAEAIFGCDFTSYKYQDGYVRSGGWGMTNVFNFSHSFIGKEYSLTSEEKDKFTMWYLKTMPTINNCITNNVFGNMLLSYQRSYMIGLPSLSFIMLFSILEMVFGSGHTEITYQISRGTALLLTHSKDEMNDMFKEMKRLYAIRSRYVHQGDNIDTNSVLKLRNIVRLVLLRLIDLGYNNKERLFSELQSEILLGGSYIFTREVPNV